MQLLINYPNTLPPAAKMVELITYFFGWHVRQRRMQAVSDSLNNPVNWTFLDYQGFQGTAKGNGHRIWFLAGQILYLNKEKSHFNVFDPFFPTVFAWYSELSTLNFRDGIFWTRHYLLYHYYFGPAKSQFGISISVDRPRNLLIIRKN